MHISYRGAPHGHGGGSGDLPHGCSGRGFGRGHHDDYGPPCPKLSIPKYDGEVDPLPWLNQCDQLFRIHRTMDEEKVWLASLHMKGIAALWYYQMEKEFGVVFWPRFSDFVNMRFGPPIRFNSLGELKELQRTGTVEYQRQFLALLCRCDNLWPQHQIDLFTAGLG